MNITDVKKQIKEKSLSSFYIFTGEEIEVQRIYINKIAEVSNMSVVRANSISDIWNIMTRPTLIDEKHVYVVRDDKDFNSNATLQKQLQEDVLNGNILIILLTNVDKRTLLYKTFKDTIITFEYLSTDILIKHVQSNIALNKSNSKRLIELCANDYSRILLEIDKITRYDTKNVDKAFEELVEQGTIYTPPKDAIFDFVDAVLRRQVSRAYNLLEQCYAVGESNMALLSVLYSNAKQMLQVQSCESRDIVKSTGLTAWQVKCAKERIGKYRIGELVYMLKLIQKIQKGIVTGQIDEYMSVEYLLVNVL